MDGRRFQSNGQPEVGRQSPEEASADTAPFLKIAQCDLRQEQFTLAQFPPFGLPMFRPARSNSSALALLTFRAPGSAAPSGTSTHRPPV